MIGFIVLCVFLASKTIYAEDADSKVYVWGIDICKGNNYSFEGVTELQNVTGGQKFKGQIFMREAADDNNFYECKAYKQFGDEMKEFFMWNDKGICSSMNRYLGKLWKFVQRLAGVEKPGVCPVPALAVQINGEQSRAFVWGVEICTGPNYTIWGKADLKNITGGQAIKVDIDMSEPIGNNNKWNCNAFTDNGGKLDQILELKGSGLCKTMNRYGGELWKFISEMGGVEKPGRCPVPKKKYGVGWFPIPYNRIKIANIAIVDMVPVGTYYIKCTLYDKLETTVKGCFSFHATTID